MHVELYITMCGTILQPTLYFNKNFQYQKRKSDIIRTLTHKSSDEVIANRTCRGVHNCGWMNSFHGPNRDSVRFFLPHYELLTRRRFNGMIKSFSGTCDPQKLELDTHFGPARKPTFIYGVILSVRFFFQVALFAAFERLNFMVYYHRRFCGRLMLTVRDEGMRLIWLADLWTWTTFHLLFWFNGKIIIYLPFLNDCLCIINYLLLCYLKISQLINICVGKVLSTNCKCRVL